MPPLITLTTDFGLTDGFVGVLRGVILSIAPDAQIVDITHGIAPQQIQQGAFVLANSVPYFPRAAIHVCIVDPGVGSARRPIAIQVGETIFVAPDNGVISLAVAELSANETISPVAVQLDNPRYWLPRVSNTFHGRDIFAPVAAQLACGASLSELGTPVVSWTTLTTPAPDRRPDGALVGQVIYIDIYGNLVTNINPEQLDDFDTAKLCIQVGKRELRGLGRTYSDVAPGEIAALIGSPWKLEIARRDGNAAQALGVKLGDKVIVSPS